MQQTDSKEGGPSAGPAVPPPRLVEVLVPVAVDTAYTYRLPDGMEVVPGQIVTVPLGPRLALGVVWPGAGDAGVARRRLRAVAEVVDFPPLDRTLVDFVEWVARYTLTPRGMVLRMVLRVPEALAPEKTTSGVRFAGHEPERMTAARDRVLEHARHGLAWTKAGLAAVAGVSTAVVEGLVRQGVLEPVGIPPPPAAEPPDPGYATPALSPDQARAVAALREAGGFGVTLIEGVTGSGKTAVYLEAVAAALARGRQALVLLPEIALTESVLDRFAARFGARPGAWHSDITPRQRARLWRGTADGGVRVVVGARSALYLPFRDLGLIVVDEEHEAGYKQTEYASYHARDMAVVRGRLGNIPVVLASATPSLETRVNVEWGRYARLELPSRLSGAPLPEIRALDLRRDRPPRGRWLAPGLVAAVGETLARGEQALLFLNRRGYAPLTVCRGCGHRFACPNCSAWLVEHRYRGTLQCHHCDHVMPRPEACPSCGAVDSLTAVGPGVERVAEEAAALWPDRRRIVLSSDMLGGIARMRADLKAVADGEYDVLIGTQLVAKGHTFPRLTLVGVVDADLGFASGDLRAAERSFQMLAQVTGRAGRVAGPGRAILQTHAPDHPVIAALVSGDAARFYEAERAERERAGMPPYGRLAAIVVAGPEQGPTREHAKAFARAAPMDADVEVLGPADAPLARLGGLHRVRLLVRSGRSFDLSAWLRRWVAEAPPPRGGIRVHVDVDPQSFM